MTDLERAITAGSDHPLAIRTELDVLDGLSMTFVSIDTPLPPNVPYLLQTVLYHYSNQTAQTSNLSIGVHRARGKDVSIGMKILAAYGCLVTRHRPNS